MRPSFQRYYFYIFSNASHYHSANVYKSPRVYTKEVIHITQAYCKSPIMVAHLQFEM